MTRHQYYCPLTGTALSLAEADLLKVVNTAVAQTKLYNVSGDLLKDQVSDMLISEPTDTAYLITTGIPQLLPQLAISLAGLNRGNSVD